MTWSPGLVGETERERDDGTLRVTRESESDGWKSWLGVTIRTG